MDQFLARYRPRIAAVLSGFDRLVFRGTLLPLVMPGGMFCFLQRANVGLLDFKDYVLATSERVKAAALREAVEHDRPVRYLESSTTDKEKLARRLLAEHPLEEGLICAFKTVEPCMSFEYHRSPDPRERGLRLRRRTCLHIYKYYRHRVFGFLGTRLQTWFPFNIQIWLNGREWLAHQLQRQGRTDFRRHDKCFTWLGDPALAQRLMDQQLATAWPRALDALARSLNPLHGQIFKPSPHTYYWSAYQTEWATDVLFKTPAALAAVYPALVRHATLHFHSPDVMRFLGRKAHGNFTGELTTSFKDRAEGVRVKHWVNGNSIKMYDRPGVLRVETTIAKTADFKVFRPRQNDPAGRLAWRPLRKGVADLHRRAELSQRANERYLDALSVVDDSTPLHRLLDQVSQPTHDHGRRVRALRIGDPHDLALLQAVSRGEFATAGFRNRDLRCLLHPTTNAASAADVRRLAAKITRQLRLLRAHGVVQKIPKTHRYNLTRTGHLLTAALFAVRDATLSQLIGHAA
ncbi:MAG: hypothetical protein AAB328_05460 [candidate division NC10 bacterium]